jgi:hypothetical protein
MRATTERDFETLSWHDDTVYGLRFRIGDPARNDWTHDLVLDIDHIVEWVRDRDRMRFRVAPATLVFHGITDLCVRMDWGDSGHRVSHPAPSIGRLERAPVVDQKVFLDRPYYAWRIELNSPAGGEIRFGAVGFTQTLRCEPVLCDEQQLGSARDELEVPS